jgi:hypothetical protein
MLEAFCLNKTREKKIPKTKKKHEEKVPEKNRKKKKTDPYHHRDGCNEDE